MFRARSSAFAFAALASSTTLAVAAPKPQSAEKKPYTRNVAIVLYPGVEILDFGGPAEVFAASAGQGSKGAEKAFNCYTVSKTRDPIVSQGFIDVIPDYSIEDSPKPDILVLPGGGSQSVTNDAVWMEWIGTAAGGAEHVLTVCTGAFIAGKAGLLEGIEATTWFRAVPSLAEQFPNTRVIPGRRFIDNGKVITTAGVSAGIDGSLHLVARLLGRYVADRTAEYMEYKWSPESYMSSTYSQLNPQLDERGRTLQQASISAREGNLDASIAACRALIAADRNDAEAWLNLGRSLHEQDKYKEAIQANLQAAKSSSLRGLAYYNLACEYSLTGQRDKALDAAEKAVEAGYRAKYSFENDTDLAAIRTDTRFKALLARL